MPKKFKQWTNDDLRERGHAVSQQIDEWLAEVRAEAARQRNAAERRLDDSR